jgi:hypothetical protein
MADSTLGAPWREPVFLFWRDPQPTHKEARSSGTSDHICIAMLPGASEENAHWHLR